MGNKIKQKKEKVLVAVSGGVDSAIALKLLQAEGYQCTGVFLKFWQDKNFLYENKSSSELALNDAQKLCSNLKVPLKILDFSRDFKKEVVNNFLQEYQAGRTPNPCIICNQKIKIGSLLEKAQKLGFTYLATGHYVRREKKGKKYYLARGWDKNKDQSYFLYTLKEEQLAHLLFPLGDYKKNQVRNLAEKEGIDLARKTDSQEICFIPGKRHNPFLKKYLKLKPGEIRLLENDQKIGEHQGLPLYTIGQRRGVEIGGTGPYYVAKLDYQSNILYVVKHFADDYLYRKKMTLTKLSWVNSKKLKFPLKSDVVIRYQHPAVKCLIDYDKKNNSAEVQFFRKQRAVTPGQSAVFYEKNKVLGGGIID